jgi:GNAT superfamily N-acetyltransferase
MQKIIVADFSDADQQGVLNVILPIQQREFGISITEADQPDLTNIPGFYQARTGGFWVARSNDEVVGTVGLKDIGLRQAALRKMFVAAPFRGREFGVAGRLLDALLARARKALPGFFSAPRKNFWRRIGSTKRRVLSSCRKPNCPRPSRSWPSIRNSIL